LVKTFTALGPSWSLDTPPSKQLSLEGTWAVVAGIGIGIVGSS
jgi:hypothetical protein